MGVTTAVQQQLLRELPAIEPLLHLPVALELVQQYGRSLTLEALRHSLNNQRQMILNGQGNGSLPVLLIEDVILAGATAWLEELLAPTLRPVINATGVIIHTNLGRAPLSDAALTAVATVGGHYATLEYELESGQRGSRTLHAEQLLTRLTGAEAALVVNNNAAAILLMLSSLCAGKEVIISRGQLVEIGGGFRIPDVLAQSGAKLIEVGTTNRTHLPDYAHAITPNTAALLVIHHSNYKIMGFTSEPSLSELAELAHKHALPLLYDQGSGALLDVSPYGLEPEPTVLEGLQAGCDVVAFSGDKLLGGPQAGLLCGRQSAIAQLKKHPLARAVRADKLALAGLAATLTDYLSGQATAKIPVWRMIAYPLTELADTANEWARVLQTKGVPAEVVDGRSTVGGGSLPGTSLPTYLVAIAHPQPDLFAYALRQHATPIIGRIQDGRYLLDPRTVLPAQTQPLLEAICQRFNTPL